MTLSIRPGRSLLPGRKRWAPAAGLVAGVALDALIGDPRRGHPVAAFGSAAAALEARDYADSRRSGAVHVAACVLGVTIPAVFLQRRVRDRPLFQFAAAALTTWAVVGARSLRSESERTVVPLATDDLPAARDILPSLCGRDPAGLGAKEIARAIIESVAENTSDAVVAPLLWGAAAGLPGLVAYRAINTLDAMVGHHSPRYERFGWAAARLDDVANWIPARVTALLTVACAPGTQRAAWRAFRVYGGQHPSPNAGHCEAAFAGALGVRLGGTNVYHGVAEHRPELGDGRAPDVNDIRSACLLARNVNITATAVAAVIALRPKRRRGQRRGSGR
jgi:adenosylcobinamide-phosphate synthase